MFSNDRDREWTDGFTIHANICISIQQALVPEPFKQTSSNIL